MEDGILINCPSVKPNHRGSKLFKIRRRRARRNKRDPEEPGCTLRYTGSNGIRDRTPKRTVRIRQKRKARKVQNVTADALVGFAEPTRPKLERRLQAVPAKYAHGHHPLL